MAIHNWKLFALKQSGFRSLSNEGWHDLFVLMKIFKNLSPTHQSAFWDIYRSKKYFYRTHCGRNIGVAVYFAFLSKSVWSLNSTHGWSSSFLILTHFVHVLIHVYDTLPTMFTSLGHCNKLQSITCLQFSCLVCYDMCFAFCIFWVCCYRDYMSNWFFNLYFSTYP